ncbi:hypothetical protein I5860_017045 [Clostridioides difficile]
MTVSGTANQAVQTDLDNVSVLVKAETYLKQLLQIQQQMQHLKLKNMWHQQ